MNDNFDKWIDFLNPENLRGNLISSSLYIAVYESFQDYIVEEVKFFFHSGFKDNVDIFSPKYNTSVLAKDKNLLNASLLWLKELGAIDENDIDKFHEIRKFRNKLTHEMMDLLFEGIPKDLPNYFSDLINLRTKIEKWWVLNIEIPTNPDIEYSHEISEKDIMTSSQIIYRIILDMLSNDKKTATFYRDEFLT